MADHDDGPENNSLSFGPFSLFVTERILKRGNDPILLGGRALDILITLAERAGEIVSRKELITRAWPTANVEEANLRVQVAGLRKALGDGCTGVRYVINIPGRGYSFVAPVSRSTAQPASAVVPPAVANQLRALPSRLTRMIGRDDIVRTLSAQLMMCRCLSVVGPGGMGKTRVAISVAQGLFTAFNGAVCFVDLAAATDARLVPDVVASAFGLKVRGQDPIASLLDYIHDKKVLLVLDNCEHVIDVAAQLVERVVGEAPQAHVLTTSREALRAEGEHVRLLNALDCPLEDTDLKAAEALRHSAVQLFMDRAAAGGYISGLTDADAPSVARICQRLNGIPLAIEIAAGCVGSHGIEGTEGLLDDCFKLLWLGRRTAPPRHQTLHAMLDWSYRVLPQLEKVVLRRLSVFIGAFTLQAACSVASNHEVDDAEVATAVMKLVEKSLIASSEIDGATYYRLLDTTRAYAAAKLAKCGEADCLVRGPISYSKGSVGVPSGGWSARVGPAIAPSLAGRADENAERRMRISGGHWSAPGQHDHP